MKGFAFNDNNTTINLGEGSYIDLSKGLIIFITNEEHELEKNFNEPISNESMDNFKFDEGDYIMPK